MKSYYCDGFRNCVLNCRNFVQVPCFHALKSCKETDFTLYLHYEIINPYSIINLKEITLMKKLFTLAALALCALTINAQTTISFSEVKAAGSLNGQTITSTLDGFSLTVTDTKKKVSVDGNEARFGTAESNTLYEYRLKSGGKSSSANCMSIAVPSSGTLEICVRTGKNGETDRNLVLTQDGKELYNKVVQESDATSITIDGNESKVYPIVSVAVDKGTIDVTYPTNSLNFYAFTFTPTTTGISSTVQAKKTNNVADYNLAGQRVDKNYKGIVISDGKKVIRK